MCRGRFCVGSAFRYHAKLIKDYGQDGLRGGTPAFDEYMATAAGRAELRIFACRCTARFKAELSEQPLHLLKGAYPDGNDNCLVGDALSLACPARQR